MLVLPARAAAAAVRWCDHRFPALPESMKRRKIFARARPGDRASDRCLSFQTRMKLHRAFLVVLLLSAAAGSIFFLPVREWFSLFEAYVYSLGAVGPIVYALGYAVLTVLLF